MKIGIDISQTVYEGTGVNRILESLILYLAKIDRENEYILFFSSLRRSVNSQIASIRNINKKVTIKKFKIPPVILDFIWNKLHIIPIEWFIGNIDIFITSDWTEPPTLKARKMTILYDLIIYLFPQQTDKKIVSVQKRKLKWVQKESEKIICISEATKNDAMRILDIKKDRLVVVYPGI